METDMLVASLVFWQTVQHLRKGEMRPCTSSAEQVCGVLTFTGDTVAQRKEHFDKLLDSVDKPFLNEPMPGISGVMEVHKLYVHMEVTNLHSEKTAGVDDMLKALYKLGVVWLPHLFNTAWRSGVPSLYQQTGIVISILKRGRSEGVSL